MSTADIFFSIFDRLKDMIRRSADAKQAERQAVADALAAAVNVANRTMRYIARRREGGQRDQQEEAALSQGWTEAGVKLFQLPKPADELTNRFFLKAEYWSDPQSWTDERVNAAMIRLDELAKESRETLLGMKPGK
jgi:hypothetical protein